MMPHSLIVLTVLVIISTSVSVSETLCNMYTKSQNTKHVAQNGHIDNNRFVVKMNYDKVLVKLYCVLLLFCIVWKCSFCINFLLLAITICHFLLLPNVIIFIVS